MVDGPLLVVGAGRHQVGLIGAAERRGIEVVAVDYREDSPGKAAATHAVLADALDVAANIEIARRFDVNGVVTVGTDQTVAVVAAVADALGLPCHVDPEAARWATNKSAMRERLIAAGVRMPPGRVVGSPEERDRALSLPLIVKPVDSQGQRGTSMVRDAENMANAVAEALAASRAGHAVIESVVPGPEVTINGWVHDGVAHLLAINDRVTYNPPPAVGICLQHVYPSLHAHALGERATETIQRVATAYRMNDGPLYVQCIVDDDGFVVLEAAARVGGGHEMSLLPAVGGTDLVERSIDLALGLPTSQPTELHRDEPDGPHGLVNFIVAKPGVFARYDGIEQACTEGLAVEGEWYYPAGYEQAPIVNSMGRVGYFVATAETRAALLESAMQVYRSLSATDTTGRNLVFWPEADQLLGLDGTADDPRA